MSKENKIKNKKGRKKDHKEKGRKEGGERKRETFEDSSHNKHIPTYSQIRTDIHIYKYK